MLDWETEPWQPRLEHLIAHGVLQVEDLDVALPVVLQLADLELPEGDKVLAGRLKCYVTGQGRPKTRNQSKLIRPRPRSSASPGAAWALKINIRF